MRENENNMPLGFTKEDITKFERLVLFYEKCRDKPNSIESVNNIFKQGMKEDVDSFLKRFIPIVLKFYKAVTGKDYE